MSGTKWGITPTFGMFVDASERERMRELYGAEEGDRLADVVDRARALRAYIETTERLLVPDEHGQVRAHLAHLDRDVRAAEIDAMYRVVAQVTESRETTMVGRTIVQALAKVSGEMTAHPVISSAGRDRFQVAPMQATPMQVRRAAAESAAAHVIELVRARHSSKWADRLRKHESKLRAAVRAWIETGRAGGKEKSKWAETVRLLRSLGIQVGVEAARAWIKPGK